MWNTFEKVDIQLRLKSSADELLIQEHGVMSAAEAIVNIALKPLDALLDREIYNDLEATVNLALVQAAEDGFVAGVRFMQDPASFILEKEKS